MRNSIPKQKHIVLLGLDDREVKSLDRKAWPSTVLGVMQDNSRGLDNRLDPKPYAKCGT